MNVLYISHTGCLDGSGIALLNILKCLPRDIHPMVSLPYKGALADVLDKEHFQYFIVRVIPNCHPRMDSV